MELENTPDGRRSEALLRVCGPGSGWLWTVLSIAICHQWGEKWRLGALFLAIFGLDLMIVLMISIAAYLVWIRTWFDDSVNDFDCRLPGVDKESKTKITPFKVQKVQLNS